MNKTSYLILLSIFFTIQIAKAQHNDSNSDVLNSIAIQPPNQFISPNETFSNPVTVNGFDNFSLGTDFGEPYIATNPRDPFNSICAFNINNFYYTLDGFDWKKISVFFSGFSVIGDPVVTYDSIGNAYYVQLYQNGSVYGICIAKSTNKGVNWTSSYNVYTSTSGLSDKEWLAADRSNGPYSNNLYVAWRQFGSSGMRVTTSSNFGANWTSPLTFSGQQGASLTVGPNGNIQGGSVYFAANISNGTIVVNRSTDGGQNFSSQVTASSFTPGGTGCAGRQTVKNCIRMNSFPAMAADNSYTSSRGNVYVVYCNNPGGGDIADINLVRSTDYGASWSAPVRVNDDNTTTDQWLPAVSVDSKTGRVFICWFDSREDPNGNLLTKLYGTVSTNGGISFTPNTAVSNALFNPNSMAVGQPGGENYIGDYLGNSAIGNTSYAVWMDGRNNNLGSYTAYYPDFAMTLNNASAKLGNNDSAKLTIKIPSINGPFIDRVRFNAVLDTLPTSGTISFSFQNGKDSISTFPDSVILVIKTNGSVPAKGYGFSIIGKGTQGPPIHIRKASVLVNSSFVNIGTNRPGIAEYKVNGVTYNQPQQLIFANGSVISVQAVSPRTVGNNQYVFVNWSDGGDTTHNVTINSDVNLSAFYKVKYRLIISSSQGTTFGGGIYYDSSSSVTFGVNSRVVINGGTTYFFRGWNGTGNGSYTSADSLGLDSAATITIHSPIVETARWTTTSEINQISTEIPVEYNLYQNYPNPFNPNTNVKFDIIKSGNVKIIIYNALGKEVETLFNDNLSPGSYRVDFNGNNFASGIYYYKIITDNFTAVRKMLLVK